MANLKYPERLLQPWKDLRQFTQELYAMLRGGDEEDVSGGIDVDTPPVKVGEQSFRVQRRRSGELALIPEAKERPRPGEPSEGPPKFTPPSRRPRVEEGRRQVETVADERLRRAAETPKLPEPSRARREQRTEIVQDEPRRREPAELPGFTPRRPAEAGDSARRVVEPLKVEQAPQEPGKPRKPIPIINVGTNPDYPLRQVPSGGGGGTNVFVGKVLSGSGDTYSVALYPDGPNAAAGDTVTVTIPVMDPDEKIDHDTWLYSIFEFADEDGHLTHTCQPPVWMA